MNSILFLLFGVLAGANAATLAKHLDPRIINGENVKLGEIPYQVSLQTRGLHFCGGSVLNASCILTAAHCVQNQKVETIVVVAGTVNLHSRPTVCQATEAIIHENYNPHNNWINDIALIKIDPPLELNSEVSAVPLPKANEDISAGSVAIVSGWGRLQPDGVISNELKKARINITDQNDCKKVNGNIFDTQMCTNDPSTKIGACLGDSGSPLTVNGKIVGVVSQKVGCGLPNHPTIYTRVPSYVSWIQQHAV